MNPVVVHVVRPYATEQEYLAAEAWSIDARGMLLIGADTLAPDTAVLFDVALSDGQKPIRAEGRVVQVVAPSSGRPGGLKVRFKRFGAATKAFIERAVKAQSTSSEPDRPSQPEADRPSAPEAEQPSQVELDRPSMPEVRASMTELEAPAALPSPPSPEREREREPSSLRQRVPGPVSAPANREELLQRLRQRRHSA
ncbi:MAG TPA: hypothetical protein VHP33_06945 [Polyangiaceae bacterium]|nr:hypothetical protein [Polyangiaceae bacterium]